MSEQHQRDETVPIEFIKHVGPVARCICGRDYVGGYRCPAAPTPPAAVPVAPTEIGEQRG